MSSSILAGEKNHVGSPQDLIDRLLSEESIVSKRFFLENTQNDSIELDLEGYHFQDGYMAIHGNATHDANSSFLLKGTKFNISGFIAFHSNNEAYEYRTLSNGEVYVEKVDINTVHPICDIDPSEDIYDFYIEQPNWGNGASEPHIGKYPGSDVNKLQSLPGAKKVMYMDITRVMNGDTPKTNGKFNKEQMWQTWQSVASALSMYEVNVTTDASVYKKAGVKNSGIARFINSKGRSNAPLNSFGTTRYSSNYYLGNDGYGLGRTAAHEIGHQVGLHHDKGQPGGEYFTGFPEFKWTPLMGNYWPGNRWGDQALYQWSKSEYDSGTNKQDDLKIMQKYFTYRKDDIPSSKALVIKSGKVAISDNMGQIGKNEDTDSFTFEVASSGQVKLKIDRIEYLGGAMLDIDAVLKDSSDKVVAKDNPKAKRYAEIDVDLEPGKYTLIIKGGAEGTPRKGFSNYSSLGFYGIEGTIAGDF